jgi:hypothetical protein
LYCSETGRNHSTPSPLGVLAKVLILLDLVVDLFGKVLIVDTLSVKY